MSTAAARSVSFTRSSLASFLVLALALGGGAVVVGCSGDHSGSGTAAAADMTADAKGMTPAPVESHAPASHAPASQAAASHGAGGEHDFTLTAAEVDAAWAVRPAYVRDGAPAVREAYAYALQQGGALTWMPCWCGCEAMEHRSNLDCFFKPRRAGEPVVFEEHASYCDICIETALMTKHMLAAGSSLAQIRAAVDDEFGDSGAPSTRTELPPS